MFQDLRCGQAGNSPAPVQHRLRQSHQAKPRGNSWYERFQFDCELLIFSVLVSMDFGESTEDGMVDAFVLLQNGDIYKLTLNRDFIFPNGEPCLEGI